MYVHGLVPALAADRCQGDDTKGLCNMLGWFTKLVALSVTAICHPVRTSSSRLHTVQQPIDENYAMPMKARDSVVTSSDELLHDGRSFLTDFSIARFHHLRTHTCKALCSWTLLHHTCSETSYQAFSFTDSSSAVRPRL